MKSLVIFHDPRCGLCCRFREWLSAEPARVRIEFMDHRAPEAERLLPGLGEMGADRNVVVLADDGRWWQGAGAWLTCLWATHRHRAWAYRLASPAMRPLATRAIHLISSHRLSLSNLLRLRGEEAGICADGSCQLPVPPPLPPPLPASAPPVSHPNPYPDPS